MADRAANGPRYGAPAPGPPRADHQILEPLPTYQIEQLRHAHIHAVCCVVRGCPATLLCNVWGLDAAKQVASTHGWHAEDAFVACPEHRHMAPRIRDIIEGRR